MVMEGHSLHVAWSEICPNLYHMSFSKTSSIYDMVYEYDKIIENTMNNEYSQTQRGLWVK